MNLNVSEVIKNFEYFLFKIVIVFALREHTFYIYKHHDEKVTKYLSSYFDLFFTSSWHSVLTYAKNQCRL